MIDVARAPCDRSHFGRAAAPRHSTPWWQMGPAAVGPHAKAPLSMVEGAQEVLQWPRAGGPGDGPASAAIPAAEGQDALVSESGLSARSARFQSHP